MADSINPSATVKPSFNIHSKLPRRRFDAVIVGAGGSGMRASLQLAEAGLDFIKDDELMANPPHSPFPIRVQRVMQVLNAHSARPGKKVQYAFNLPDERDAMRRHHAPLTGAGGH